MINEENSNKTVKIIHNINNIIINNKNNNKKNEMIININSNYYQLKNANTNANTNANNNIKNKEKIIKNLKDKIKKIDLNKKKRNKIINEAKTFTTYNALSNTANKMKPIFKNIKPPKTDIKKKFLVIVIIKIIIIKRKLVVMI